MAGRLIRTTTRVLSYILLSQFVFCFASNVHSGAYNHICVHVKPKHKVCHEIWTSMAYILRAT